MSFDWFFNSLDRLDPRLCRIGLWKTASWADVSSGHVRHLYAGTLSHGDHLFSSRYGLQRGGSSHRNLLHDVRKPMPIPDGIIETYQAEDVLEYVPYDEMIDIFNEIFRVLKPGGLFRLSLPDYRNPTYSSRCWRTEEGTILFDPGGGGQFVDGKVIGGHLWFPLYETVKAAFDHSQFACGGEVNFLHYTAPDGHSVLREIDYSRGVIRRTPDFDPRAQNPRICLSIVVDAIKSLGSAHVPRPNKPLRHEMKPL